MGWLNERAILLAILVLTMLIVGSIFRPKFAGVMEKVTKVESLQERRSTR